MKQVLCPCCRNADLEDFFTIRNAPVHSVATMKSFDEAAKVPRKDLELTFCNTCGFIFNSLFDTSVDYFTQGYEDQQGFSPTFMRFLSGVTQRFIDKYDIHGKQVVEIGCGKGDFLHLICELGNNSGTGIDPTWVPGRRDENPNVEFIPEFYSETHGAKGADCITCRHTFEHIHDPAGFLQTLRSSIGTGSPVLLFEVPCMTRILEVHAFWDIYCEHCSYFSPGSIARVFRHSGFEVLDLYREYDDQYLFIEARPAGDESGNEHAPEESVEEMRFKARLFARQTGHILAEWRERLTRFKEENQRVVVWGGGSKAVGFLTQFDDLNAVGHVVDINPHIQGNYIPGIGKQYVGPEFLDAYRPDIVIVMNAVYLEEIKNQLAAKGLHPEFLALD